MISVAYSPDADDAFMFWALETGRLDHDRVFNFARYDTETLNLRALEGHDDISAVSVGVLPQILGTYRLLPHGGSIGNNYGPVVVERRDAPGDWQQGPVAIPGEHTTAALVFRRLHPDVPTIEVPITPFAEAFDCLGDGRARASLLIHEGRLTYERHDCRLIEDIGQQWHKQTGLPLPLGVNVIRRSLPEDDQRALEQLVGDSIRMALEHRDEAISWLIDSGAGNLTTPEEVSAYLDLYANAETAATPAPAVDAMIELLGNVSRNELDGSFWRF